MISLPFDAVKKHRTNLIKEVHGLIFIYDSEKQGKTAWVRDLLQHHIKSS